MMPWRRRVALTAASLTERLALTVTFDLRYDSEPPDGLAALDTKLKTGGSFTS